MTKRDTAGLPVAVDAELAPTGRDSTLGDFAIAPVLRGSAFENATLVYLAALSTGSRPAMRGALAKIAALLRGDVDLVGPPDDWTDGHGEWLLMLAASFPWHEVRYRHAQAVRTALQAEYSPSTVNRMLSALRGVLRESWRLGLVDAETYHRAADVKAVKGGGPSQAEAGRQVSSGEIAALAAVCKDDVRPTGVRDAALLAVGFTCGLRRAEIAGLDVQDFDPDGHTLFVRGKGHKERFVPIGNGALDAMRQWLSVRGDENGPIFQAIRKDGEILGDRLSTTAIHRVIRRRAEQTGVKTFAPHDMRRTFASTLLTAGVDVFTVQGLMGHSSPTTTEGYDMRDARAKQEAVSRLHFPWTWDGAS